MSILEPLLTHTRTHARKHTHTHTHIRGVHGSIQQTKHALATGKLLHNCGSFKGGKIVLLLVYKLSEVFLSCTLAQEKE